MATDEEIEETVNEAGPPKEQTAAQKRIVEQAKIDFKHAADWEAYARNNFDYDYKFANGDTHNKYQWDQEILNDRTNRPCLTVNKTQQHNLLIINDAKKNKAGVRIRPVGDEATFEAAQIYQEIIYHIEYISNADNVYDNAVSWAVQAGIGYWQVVTQPLSIDTFDQEIYIRRIKDPKSVYLDPNINEIDGSDARWAIVFEDIPKSVFKETYPEYASIVGTSTLDGSNTDGWITQTNIRIAKYYRKSQNKDKLITFVTDDGQQILKRLGVMSAEEKAFYKQASKNKAAKEYYQYRERSVLTDNITCYTIAGNSVVEEKPWLGKYIPIVRVPGIETVIDGILDRKGHTRALINAQQIYNYNTSSNVEYGALQTKAPWLIPSAGIGENIDYWTSANVKNHAYLPYEHIDDNGDPIPAPSRPQAPQPGPAYVQGLQIAQNEMMMASGQWQSQFGENENAKSGVAINARQRQGDTATYHFPDNQAIGIRFTGKIIIDLIPKIYDTERIMRIDATDGSILNVQVDPNAPQAVQQIEQPNGPVKDKGRIVKEIVFNPNVGMYDIQADTGPSYATKRMEAAAAFTQIAASDKEFMNKYGDFFFSVLDFPKADQMAERAKKFLPPGIADDNAPDPQTEQLMHQASDHIQQLTKELQETQQKLADREKELTIKAQDLDLRFKEAKSREVREDYKAYSDRLAKIGNSGPAVSLEQIQPVLKQLLMEMVQNGDLNVNDIVDAPGMHEGGTSPLPPEPMEGEGGGEKTSPEPTSPEEPPIPGARKAPDGFHYIEHAPGQFARVEA